MPRKRESLHAATKLRARNQPDFILEVRPTSVPDDLVTLAGDTRVSYVRRGNLYASSSVMSAKALRAHIEETMSRQADGFFTPEEAAHILADSLSGLDPKEVLQRIRNAHSEGNLAIHRGGGSRFRMKASEAVTEYWDLLEATEFDRWLRESTKYQFPGAEGAGATDPTEQARAAPELPPDRGRKLKRCKLIEDNRAWWGSIEGDLHDSAANGLSEAARVSKQFGYWWEGSAHEWARARGKLKEPAAPGVRHVSPLGAN